MQQFEPKNYENHKTQYIFVRYIYCVLLSLTSFNSNIVKSKDTVQCYYSNLLLCIVKVFQNLYLIFGCHKPNTIFFPQLFLNYMLFVKRKRCKTVLVIFCKAFRTLSN